MAAKHCSCTRWRLRMVWNRVAVTFFTCIRTAVLFVFAGVALADDFIGDSRLGRLRRCLVLDFLERRRAAPAPDGNDLAHDAESDFLGTGSSEIETSGRPDAFNFFRRNALGQQVVQHKARA